MDTAVPLLSYGRASARRLASERLRTLRGPDGTTVAVFPAGIRASDFLPLLMSALLVSGILTAAALHFWHHPVPLGRFLAAVWPLGAVLLFLLGMLAVAFDEAHRQVEFEIDGCEIVRLSFGPFGRRRRHWDRAAVRGVVVETHVSGTHPRVVLVLVDGKRHELLNPGAAGALRAHAEDVARNLRQALPA